MRYYEIIQEETSPALKQWFGNSKIMDHDGDPAVVHHFTHNDFDEFDRHWAARHFGRNMDGIDTIGLWFTDNPNIRYGPKRMDCYLKIVNPFYFDDETAEHELITLKVGDREEKYRGVSWVQLYKMMQDAGGAEALRNELKAKGHDGIVFTGTKLDGKVQNCMIAFEPNQIKSVNSKAFDPTKISIDEEENTENLITMYHGGRNLEYDFNEIQGNKSGQIVHGVGLYLISDVSIAAKYAKGGNKLYRVTFRKGNRADDVSIPMDVALDYCKTLPNNSNKKEMIHFLTTKYKDEIKAEYLSNLVLNYDLLKPAKTADFRRFMVSQGVDYAVSNNFGGSSNKMVVLVNPKVIKKVEIIKWNDLDQSEYHLDVDV